MAIRKVPITLTCLYCSAPFEVKNSSRPKSCGRPECNLERRHRSRRQKTLADYQTTEAEVQAAFEAQGRKCPICGTTDPGHWSGRWSVDHDHKKMRFRGVLCNSCNPGLGYFKDDPKLLRAAADYLERNQDGQA